MTVTVSPPSPVPLLPLPYVINTIRISHTELRTLDRAQTFLESVSFLKAEAQGLGIPGAFIALRSESGAVIVRRLHSLDTTTSSGGARVLTDGGADGMVESHPLGAVMEDEPTPEQWKAAVAEAAKRMLQGQMGHILMREVKSTSERLARLQRCADVLASYTLLRKSASSGSGAAAAAAVAEATRAAAPPGVELDIRLYDALRHALRAAVMPDRAWNGWCKELRRFLWGLESAQLLVAHGCLEQPTTQQPQPEPKEQPQQQYQMPQEPGPERQLLPLPVASDAERQQPPVWGGHALGPLPGQQQMQQRDQAPPCPTSAAAGGDAAQQPAGQRVRERWRDRFRQGFMAAEASAGAGAAPAEVAVAAGMVTSAAACYDPDGSARQDLGRRGSTGKEERREGHGAHGEAQPPTIPPALRWEVVQVNHKAFEALCDEPLLRDNDGAALAPSPRRLRQCAVAGSVPAASAPDGTDGSSQLAPPQPRKRRPQSRSRSASRSGPESRSPSPQRLRRGPNQDGRDHRGGGGGGGADRPTAMAEPSGRSPDDRPHPPLLRPPGDSSTWTRNQWARAVLRYLQSKPGGSAEVQELVRQGLAIPQHLLSEAGKGPSGFLHGFSHFWTLSSKGSTRGMVLTAKKMQPLLPACEAADGTGGGGGGGSIAAGGGEPREREQGQEPGQQQQRSERKEQQKGWWWQKRDWQEDEEVGETAREAARAHDDERERERSQRPPGPRVQHPQQQQQQPRQRGAGKGEGEDRGGGREIPLEGMSEAEAAYMCRLGAFLRTRPGGIPLSDLHMHNLEVPPAVLRGRTPTQWANQHRAIWSASGRTPLVIKLLPMWL